MPIQTAEIYVSHVLRGGVRSRVRPCATVAFAVVASVVMLLAIRGQARPRLPLQAAQLNAQTGIQSGDQAKQVEEGKTLFGDNCTRCHVDGDAPSLNGLFKNKTLPSGDPATDENVRNKILKGGDIMPGYEDKLTTAQIDALMAYLHTL